MIVELNDALQVSTIECDDRLKRLKAGDRWIDRAMQQKTGQQATIETSTAKRTKAKSTWVRTSGWAYGSVCEPDSQRLYAVVRVESRDGAKMMMASVWASSAR